MRKATRKNFRVAPLAIVPSFAFFALQIVFASWSSGAQAQTATPSGLPTENGNPAPGSTQTSSTSEENFRQLESQDTASAYRIDKGFKTTLQGEIHTGYEHLDGGESTLNPNQQNSGFRVDSIGFAIMSEYLGPTLRGTMLNIALNLQLASDLRDGCTTHAASSSTAAKRGCANSNDYLLVLQYAYVQFPLTSPLSSGGNNTGNGRQWFILGQQPTPIVQEYGNYWTEAHVADDIFQTIGYIPESDRGIGYIYEDSTAFVHLLLANGEGSSYLNADPSAPSPRSQGLGLQGVIRIRPELEESSMAKFNLLFPFQADNFLRFRSQPTSSPFRPVSTPTDPAEAIQTPDLTQIRSYSYGWSTDLSLDDGVNRWNAQIGSYFLENPAFTPINANSQTPRAFGRMDFFQTSYKYDFWSLFYRYYETTSLFDSSGAFEALPAGRTGGKTTRNLWGMSFYLKPPWEFFVISIGSDTILATYLPSENASETVSLRSIELFFRMGMSWSFSLD